MALLDDDFRTEGSEVRSLAPEPAIPLCVDLDGTLLRSDALVEGLLAAAARPRLYPALLRAARHGRAALKAAVAGATHLDPELLPYNRPFLAFLHRQKAAGRRLVLVTAADAAIAQEVADFLQLFDEVLASDGTNNLKGSRKAALLVSRFGSGNFCYAGNSRADLPVWAAARHAILVDAPPALAATARNLAEVEAEFPNPVPVFHALARAIRPHQWAKNLLVFVPLLVSGADLGDALVPTLAAFAAFSAVASGIYLANDLSDLAADRKHPRKRRRPLANGDLPLPAALLAAPLLIASGLFLAHTVGILAVVAAYGALSLGYSLRLKELPLIDVFVLAALYTIRMVGGGEAAGHRVSLWLFAFSSFLFLSLALVKRGSELAASPPGDNAFLPRRGYYASDAATLQVFGSGASVAACVMLAMFVQAETSQHRYATPELLWAVIPLVLFWQCRIWLSTSRGYMHDDPIVYAAKDWVSWLVVLAVGAILAIARFVVLPG